MAVPYSLEDTLRIHDVAFMRWLLGLKVDYGTIAGKAQADVPILAVMQSPDRAFAEVPDLLVERDWIDGSTAQEMRANAKVNFEVLPLPVASVERGEPSPFADFNGVPKRYRQMFFNKTNNRYETHRHPAFFMTTYTVTVMGLSRYTAAWVWEWFISELGELGMGDNEVLLDVVHSEPFGTLKQALKWTGSADLSAWEGGDEPRYVTKQYTFDLRTIFFKTPETLNAGDGYVVENIEYCPEHFVGEHYPENLWLGGDHGQLSANLFRIPRMNSVWTRWPTEGDATVEKYEYWDRRIGRMVTPENGITIRVTDDGDVAEIGELELYKNAEGFDLFTVSFEYNADGESKFHAYSREYGPPESMRPIMTVDLPATRRLKTEKFERFIPADYDTMSARIAGVPGGAAHSVNLTNVSVQRISLLQNFSPDNIIDTGTERRYEWLNLAVKKPFIVMAKLLSTGGGTETITIEDDVASPSYTITRQINEATDAFIAEMLQPKVNQLVLRVPLTVSLATILALRYYGPNKGHTVA